MAGSSIAVPVIEAPRIEGELEVADGDVVESLAWLHRLSITEADLGGRELERLEVSACVFSGVTFTGATLLNIELEDVVFRGCELSGCTFEDSKLTRVAFEGCRMRAAAFPQVEASHVAFESCLMAEVWMRMAKLDRVRIEDCNLEQADFYSTSFRKSRILRSDLSRAELSQASFEEVALHGSVLTGIKGAGTLRGLIIASSQVFDLAQPMFAALRIRIDDTYIDTGPEADET